jgi:hypothetical protein
MRDAEDEPPAFGETEMRSERFDGRYRQLGSDER